MKEVSYSFEAGSLGLGLIPSEKLGSLRTAVVSSVTKGSELCPSIRIGDVISRVGGVSVSGLNFPGIFISLVY